MGNDSYEHADSCGVPERALCACGVLWAADIGMGMLRNGRYVRPATCGVRQLRELGCALGQLVQVAEICIAALSGRLEMPCECASRPHIHARVCTWHAIVQMEVRMCYRRPRRVYASRCPELKRAVRSPGRCSRAAKAVSWSNSKSNDRFNGRNGRIRANE